MLAIIFVLMIRLRFQPTYVPFFEKIVKHNVKARGHVNRPWKTEYG